MGIISPSHLTNINYDFVILLILINIILDYVLYYYLK